MSRKLTASDRKALIRLASKMEKGSEERKAILAGLKGASTKTAGMSAKDMKRLDELQKKEDHDSLTRSENAEYEALAEEYRKTPEYARAYAKAHAYRNKKGESTKTAMNYHHDLELARIEINNRYIKELARVIAKKIGGKHYAERGNELITLEPNQWLELKWPFPSAQELDVKWYDGEDTTKVSMKPRFVDSHANQIISDWGV